MKTIKIAKLDEKAVIPSRKHPDDAGIDLFSSEKSCVPAHSFSIIPTSVTVEIPKGYVGLILCKSRNNFMIGGGVVDAGYQGEIFVKVINYFTEPLDIDAGQALGQLLILPVETPEIMMVPLSEIHQTSSLRGASGGITSQVEQEHQINDAEK